MKAHLATVTYPIVFRGQTVSADCGKHVERATLCFLWDEAAMGEGLSYGKNVCGKCQLADKGPRGKMLIYGITERRQDEQSTDTTAGQE